MGGKLAFRTASAAVLAAVWASAALAAATPTIGMSSNTALGAKILVNAKGFSLYHFVPETKATIKCTAACSILWPPLVIAAGVKPTAGPGVIAAKLGTLKRPDGRIQVTYNGLALYRDFYDKSGEINGQGQDGSWFAVTPAGKVTKARPSTPAATSGAASKPTTGGQTAGGAAGDVPGPPTNCIMVNDSCLPVGN